MVPRQIRHSNSDTDSIFYVHPSEGANSLTISPKLNGLNYLASSHSMQHALGAKNKLAFMDGTILIPDLLDLNIGA